MRDPLIPGDKETTILKASELWIEAAKKAIDEKGTFYVALSGGSTPKAIYSNLADDYQDALDWDKVHLFFSDERSVPPGNTESNYNMALEFGFGRLPVPEEHIHRMVAEEDIEKGAEDYQFEIKQVLGDAPFDLIMLGMGDDGHTASLFPNTTALTEKERLVVANYIDTKETWRMTMTYPCINAAKEVHIYVLGDAKKEMVKEIFVDKKDYPVANVQPEGGAIWILDNEAAALLQ